MKTDVTVEEEKKETRKRVFFRLYGLPWVLFALASLGVSGYVLYQNNQLVSQLVNQPIEPIEPIESIATNVVSRSFQSAISPVATNFFDVVGAVPESVPKPKVLVPTPPLIEGDFTPEEQEELINYGTPPLIEGDFTPEEREELINYGKEMGKTEVRRQAVERDLATWNVDAEDLTVEFKWLEGHKVDYVRLMELMELTSSNKTLKAKVLSLNDELKDSKIILQGMKDYKKLK